MRYVLANWKMWPTVEEARALLVAVQDGLRRRAEAGAPLPRLIVCPPFVALAPLRAVADDRLLALGAQTCHWEQDGPHTGEVSPRMLLGLADYVMVGHSERRAAGETDDQVARKVEAVVDAGLVPILFVGEDDPVDDAIGRTEARLRSGLSRVDSGRQRVLIVYEPTWAIGADHAASAGHVAAVVKHVKASLVDMGSATPEVLYGGTVNDGKVDDFAALEILDGVGATRGSLDAGRFLALVDRLSPEAWR